MRREAAKIAASDKPTVHWRKPLVYLVVELKQDRDAPRSTQSHWMNRRISSGSSDGHVEASGKDLAVGSTAPDDPMMCRSIASE
jgi:hypothetical protein